MWQALVAPVAGLFTKALDVVDKFVPDKDLAERLKAALNEKIVEISHNEFLALIQGQTQIIVAEAQGKRWLQNNWRPLIMAEFGTIIFNNYILAPYLGLLFGKEYQVMLTIPPEMWELLKLGLSGYILGRSIEKVAAGEGVKGAIGRIANGSGA